MKKTIDEMEVKDILRKESFRRAIPLAVDTDNKGGSPDYDSNRKKAAISYCYPTQDDFLREWNPTSHRINSIKYYPNLFFVKEGSPHKYQAKVRSRVSVAWQRRIHTKRLVALTGFDPDISMSKAKTDKESQETLAFFKEGWADKNMDTVVHMAISADGKVGDTAVIGYREDKNFGIRLYNYDKGDILYPHYDPNTGKLSLFGRRYTTSVTNPSNGETEDIDTLDVWDSTSFIQYRETASWEKKDMDNRDWIVSIEKRNHGFSRIPVAYHRYGEPFWAASQSLIDDNEMALSQLAENNAQYAMRILYTLGAEFELTGATDGTPSQIASTEPNAKVGFLEPADSSSSFELQLKTQEKEIMRCSFACETPELKSGSDLSSLTVKMLNADSYLKALDDSREYQDFLNDIRDIFIEGYGKETDKMEAFMNLKISIKLQPWVFMSESEMVNTVVQLVSIGVLSRQSATEYIFEALGLGSVDEAERILTEAHDALVLQSQSQQQDRNTVNNRRTQTEQ